MISFLFQEAPSGYRGRSEREGGKAESLGH